MEFLGHIRRPTEQPLDQLLDLYKKYMRAIKKNKRFHQIPLNGKDPLNHDLESYRQTQLENLWQEGWETQRANGQEL